MRSQLSAVLGYVERMRGPGLEGVEPLVHVGGEVNRLGPDEPGPVLPPETLLTMAPDRMGPFVRVPKVIDEGTSA
jgi:aspartyl-tRNA(Asn)/glutamyl-tRNA(Gln) amidotransferase subunit C